MEEVDKIENIEYEENVINDLNKDITLDETVEKASIESMNKKEKEMDEEIALERNREYNLGREEYEKEETESIETQTKETYNTDKYKLEEMKRHDGDLIKSEEIIEKSQLIEDSLLVEEEIDEDDAKSEEIISDTAELESSNKEEKKSKDLLQNMRGLLNGYPLKIAFNEDNDVFAVCENIALVYDLLVFCKFKSTQEEIKKQIEDELKYLSDVNIHQIRLGVLKYRGAGSFGKFKMKQKLYKLIEADFQKIADKCQYYCLVLPNRDKKNMHLKTAHGFPASYAEDYENKEIEEGRNVDPNKPFIVNNEGNIEQIE